MKISCSKLEQYLLSKRTLAAAWVALTVALLVLPGIAEAGWLGPAKIAQGGASDRLKGKGSVSLAAWTDGTPYSPSSPFNEPIPAGPEIAPESRQMVQTLTTAESEKGFVLTVGRWTVPTYVASASTPFQSVTLKQAPPSWGVSRDYVGFPPGWSDSLNTVLPGSMRGVPIPDGAEPDPSIDAHMTILDPSRGCEFDLYGAYHSPSGWQAVWMNSTRLDGSGVYPFGMGPTASGFAADAGIVWPEELAAGHIDHALMFAYPFTKAGGPVWPATSSDGRSTAPGAIPEGARLQLDPSLDLSKLDLPPYERTIARALQQYGMILGDTGGALGLFAAGPGGFHGNPYQGILPAGDYPDLSGIPVDKFRVLATPPQTAHPQLRLQEVGCGSFG